MKKSLALLTALFTVVFLLHSCKKAETEKSLADQFAGTYLVYDTLITTPISGSCGPATDITSYMLVVSKVDDNTVSFDNFVLCSNWQLKLTTTTIAAAKVGCATISGTYTNGMFNISYAPYLNPGCSYDGRIKGIKQP